MFKKTACAVVLLMVSGTGYAMDRQDTDPMIFPMVPLPTIENDSLSLDGTGFESDYDIDTLPSEEERIRKCWAPKRGVKKRKQLSKEVKNRLRKELFPVIVLVQND